MNRPPMQFHPAKWITDVQEFTDLEELAYFRLVLYARESSEDWSSIPTDAGRLARIARLSPQRWRSVSATVLRKWTKQADGLTYRHHFLTELADRDRRWLEQKSTAGRRSAEQRKGNDRSTTVAFPSPRPLQRTIERGGNDR